MAGHNRWKQIKEKKGALDQKRGALFSKLLRAIALAAKKEPNPEFNPHLRAAILRAKQLNVPQENIERAIKRTGEQAQNIEEFIIEAYGPGGAALIIETITSNKSKTLQEIKLLLKKHNSRLAEPGSVIWAFNRPTGESSGWEPKFKQKVKTEEKENIEKLISMLENHNDVQKIYTNLQN